jgi:hypothetical protein
VVVSLVVCTSTPEGWRIVRTVRWSSMRRYGTAGSA